MSSNFARTSLALAFLRQEIYVQRHCQRQRRPYSRVFATTPSKRTCKSKKHSTCNVLIFSVENLQHLLLGFYRFHQDWEPMAARALGDRAEWFDERRKLQFLEADLRFFGKSPVDVSSSQSCAQLHAVTNETDALGSMYVLEGSTLGGQLVGRFLEKNLSLSDGRGYSYFLSYGDRVGVMWRQFGARLVEHVSDPLGPLADRLVAAADETFRQLTQCLSDAQQNHFDRTRA